MKQKIIFDFLLLGGLSAFGQQNTYHDLPVNSNVKEITVICKTHTHRVND